MCELFGFSSKSKKDITSRLKEFFDHSIDHPNGWGIAELGGSEAEIVTEPIAAYKSRIVPKLLGKGIRSDCFVAHIRRATIGSIAPDNCHPFTKKDNSGRQWTLIHNGTIFNGLELIKYKAIQAGSTDSERVLLYLIDCINEAAAEKGSELDDRERFEAVQRIIASIAYRNKLNLIIYDGSLMYAHVNMKDTLYYKKDKGSVMIATVPLDSGIWKPLPLTTVHAFRNGSTVFKGEPHGREYVDAIGAALEKLEFNI